MRVSTIKVEKYQIPSEVKISIGGYPGPWYSLQKEGDALVYTNAPTLEALDDPLRELIRPSPSQWQSFLIKLDRLGVWNWREHYELPVCDGTHWSVKIVCGSRVANSGGSNCYPGGSDGQGSGPGISRSFNSFLSAVQQLIGGREFK